MTEGNTESGLRAGFVDAMSYAASTVNIVTTDGSAGRSGVTVSAMSSVSADSPKPTLLVCVHHMSETAERIVENGVFCVNVLRDDQAVISDTFAGRLKDRFKEKFDCAEWTTQVTGAPRVVDPLVAFDCRVISRQSVGTHFVFLGEVVDLFIAGHGSPLIYANRAYGSPGRISVAKRSATGNSSAAEKPLNVGCFETFAPYLLPTLIGRLTEETGPFELNMIEGNQDRVRQSLLSGEAEIALLYGHDLPDDIETQHLTELRPYVLLAAGHPLAVKPELTPPDLIGYPAILLDVSPSVEHFEDLNRTTGNQLSVGFHSASFEMVRGLVGHGLGYAVLATRPVSGMSYDGKSLVSRPLVHGGELGRVVLAWKKDRDLSPVSKLFVRHCGELFEAEDSPV